MATPNNEAKKIKMDRLRAKDPRFTAKDKWELWKLKLEVVSKSLWLTYVAAFSVSVILVFLYFVRSGFSSGGISAADTISLALLSVGFVGTLAVLLERRHNQAN